MALYLIPVFLSENINVLPEEVIKISASLDEFIVEDEKSARKFLKQVQTKIPQDKIIFHLLNEHSQENDVLRLSEVIRQNKNIGLLSEAGCPAVADPGAQAVRIAHENNVKVIPLTGPSSILLALMASGMNGQSFVFHGYLPRESKERKEKILLLEKDALKKNQTQIFMEAPYRNMQLLADVMNVCSGNTRLCIAVNITSKEELIQTRTIIEWKKKVPQVNKVPCIYLIGK